MNLKIAQKDEYSITFQPQTTCRTNPVFREVCCTKTLHPIGTGHREGTCEPPRRHWCLAHKTCWYCANALQTKLFTFCRC